MQDNNDLLPLLAAHLVREAARNKGKAPSERELAEHFSVSRGQVREALAIMESMQVIERRAKSGIYVNRQQGSLETMVFYAQAGIPLSKEQIYNAVELRKIHEISAVELACERASEQNFDTLADILAQSEKVIAAGEGLARLDRDFHLEIVRATQNSLFYNICARFYAASEQRLPFYFKKMDRNRRSHAEHQLIFDALQQRDSDLAQALMSRHLRGAQSYWGELLEDTEDEQSR